MIRYSVDPSGVWAMRRAALPVTFTDLLQHGATGRADYKVRKASFGKYLRPQRHDVVGRLADLPVAPAGQPVGGPVVYREDQLARLSPPADAGRRRPEATAARYEVPASAPILVRCHGTVHVGFSESRSNSPLAKMASDLRTAVTTMMRNRCSGDLGGKLRKT